MRSVRRVAQPLEGTQDTGNARGHGAVAVVLDISFGFLVWAVHFLAIYCATAIACARGLETVQPSAGLWFRVGLVGATVLTVALLGWHAWRRRHGARGGDESFRHRLAIGNDAVAAFAIVIQIFPLLMLDTCQ
jgi:hypothetical protein